jgi:hypothetical protein
VVDGLYSLIAHPDGHDHVIRDVLSVVFIVIGLALLASAWKGLVTLTRSSKRSP